MTSSVAISLEGLDILEAGEVGDPGFVGQVCPPLRSAQTAWDTVRPCQPETHPRGRWSASWPSLPWLLVAASGGSVSPQEATPFAAPPAVDAGRVSGSSLYPTLTGDPPVSLAAGQLRVVGSSLYPTLAELKLGWNTDFSRRIVPLREFQRGGTGKDGIAAVDRPWRVPVRDVDFLPPDEPVVELIVDGQARAYPLGVLVRHEIVNDRVAGTPVVVTFCPLCNTAIVFDRRVGGRTLSFGTTGSLRNSDLVMYDRQTETWWQQFGGVALVGRYAGAKLRRLPSRGVLWREFAREHPHGLVVTSRRDFDLPYGKNPYLGYLDPSRPEPFPVANAQDRRLPPSERVLFVEHRGAAVAVPFSVLEAKCELTIGVGGRRLTVRLNGATADVRDEQGRLVPFLEPFWFAVAAFRPRVAPEDD